MKTITNHIYVSLASFALACFALSPAARATDLDGVLPGGNNADGVHVLINLTTGDFNTGCGWFSLSSNQAGSANTGFGAATLFSNTGDLNTATGVAALFSNTAGSATPPTERWPSLATPPAATIPPPVRTRFFRTPLASPTRLTVPVRCPATLVVAITPLLVTRRF